VVLKMWWEFKGFFGKLGQYLLECVMSQISSKMRLEYSNVKAYAKKRAEIEEKVILKDVNWLHYFETDCDFLGFPTQEDREYIKTLYGSDLLNMLQIMIQALKGYVDRFEEKNPKCEMLHEYYLLLKEEIKLRPNLPYLKGDGFLDYLQSRKARSKIKEKLENARLTGDLCIHCEGDNLRSNGNNWYCLDCGKYFRKKEND
jgi:hypothetical protein